MFTSLWISESLSCAWGCSLSKIISYVHAPAPHLLFIDRRDWHNWRGGASSCPRAAECTGWEQKKSVTAAALSRTAENWFLQSAT